MTPADRDELLRLARAAVEQRPISPPASPDLIHPGAAFVSLHTAAGDLRGCIGHTTHDQPLWQSVRDAAVSAATGDPRFSPVRADEAPGLRIEISVLGPMARIAPESVVVGRHGLYVRLGFRSGLLLPQVAVQWRWDRDAFLDQVCLKAGLPRDAWKTPQAELYAFTAEVFGEPA